MDQEDILCRPGQIIINNSNIRGSNIGNGIVKKVYCIERSLIRARNVVQVGHQSGGEINVGGESNSIYDSTDSEDKQYTADSHYFNNGKVGFEIVLERDAKLLKLNSNIKERLIMKLKELGVEKADDLQEVMKFDISPDPLKMNQARKLVRRWRKGPTYAPQFNSKLSQSKTKLRTKLAFVRRCDLPVFVVLSSIFVIVLLYNLPWPNEQVDMINP